MNYDHLIKWIVFLKNQTLNLYLIQQRQEIAFKNNKHASIMSFFSNKASSILTIMFECNQEFNFTTENLFLARPDQQ